jgi:hypothetical protein
MAGLQGNSSLFLETSLYIILLLVGENMVERSVLIQEIDSLPTCYYDEVIDFIGYIKEKKIKKASSLEKAADMAAKEYQNDKELTAFCVLDGENFYETR